MTHDRIGPFPEEAEHVRQWRLASSHNTNPLAEWTLSAEWLRPAWLGEARKRPEPVSGEVGA